ncbi:hypothetical protein CK203_032056 [Vitis vinifera]|uniref:Uncharacterized protein n=2 Tax=Vitis vinifera TaxID=29760 RepID=F6I5X6_VITVI|nr:hypothetical protein CK203_032056 [Vitis vinifera]
MGESADSGGYRGISKGELRGVLRPGNVEVLDIVHVSKEGAFPMLSTYQRRSLSEALYCHGEGVHAVSLGFSCHFHASHHCFSFAWPWRSPLRPKELWSGESEELPMPVTVLEEVQQDTALQTLHVLLLEVLPKKKVPVHSLGYYGNKVVCPGYNN